VDASDNGKGGPQVAFQTTIVTVKEFLDMTKNMGTADRVVRSVVAVVLIALIAGGQLTQTWAIVAAVVAAVFLLTSAIGFCPAYLPLKLSTRR
jgi:CBS domain containing-hemolysin-like protein